MNFIEAQRAAARRGVALPADFYAEKALDARHRMFTVSGLASISEINRVNDLFQKALNSGGSLAEFKKQMAEVGYKLPNGRFETIYRTNAQTVYNRGRLEQSLRHTDLFPYFMYDAIDDDRTRESHRALDNLIFHVINDRALWERIYPPNGYNCRCRMRTLTAKEALKYMKEYPIESVQSIVDEHGPDKGFNGLPMTAEELEAALRGRVTDLETNPFVKESFLADFDRLVEPVKVQKKIEVVVDLDVGLSGVLDNYAKALEISKARLQSKLSRSAYNMAGSLTTKEGMFLADYLIDSSGLNNFLKTGGAELSPARKAGYESALAALKGIFDNRLSLGLPIKGPLYKASSAAANYSVGDIISFDGFASFSRKLSKDGILFIMADKIGRVLPVENFTTNPAAGSFLADIGEQYKVLSVLRDQYYKRNLYKEIIYLERTSQNIGDNINNLINRGRLAWGSFGD